MHTWDMSLRVLVNCSFSVVGPTMGQMRFCGRSGFIYSITSWFSLHDSLALRPDFVHGNSYIIADPIPLTLSSQVKMKHKPDSKHVSVKTRKKKKVFIGNFFLSNEFGCCIHC